MLLSLIVYVLSIIISLLFFRENVKSSYSDYDLSDCFRSFFILFIPIFNIIYFMTVWYDDIEYEINVEELLKKIFFIKDNKNKKR